ncbi:hypothetical protein GB937_008169 [Aspergillus fischeri]|nr:hypothetical protein GB937_008169 [Aspergillus fischeri]
MPRHRQRLTRQCCIGSLDQVLQALEGRANVNRGGRRVDGQQNAGILEDATDDIPKQTTLISLLLGCLHCGVAAVNDELDDLVRYAGLELVKATIEAERDVRLGHNQERMCCLESAQYSETFI